MNEIFLAYYREFQKIANDAILRYEISCSPDDLINNAYIKLIESGEDFDDKIIRKYIVYGALKEKDAQRGTYCSYNDEFDNKFQSVNEDRTCTKCHETKPLAGFREMKFHGFSVTRTVCKMCESKERTEYGKKNRNIVNAIQRKYDRKKNAGKQRTAQPIHNLWNKANRKYQSKQRENLSDAYIRNLLRYKKVFITEEMIEEKREQLRQKRA